MDSQITFSIITPTLLRESLLRCCFSVDNQSYRNWQHIVMVDSEEWNESLISKIRNPRREIYQITPPSRNYGNTPRHVGWLHAKGEYVIYLDDDNYIMDENILKDIATHQVGVKELWSIFPILRHGNLFFHDPPECCYVDTANMLIKREIGRWPNRDEYTLDGIFCDELKSKYPYKSFPEFRPIIVMENSNEGNF